MAKTSPAGQAQTAAGSQHLHRAVGLRGLTLISLGTMIGSGWLLGALTAARVAGGASLISWIIGAAVLAVIALVHAELGSTYPVSGGTARCRCCDPAAACAWPAGEVFAMMFLQNADCQTV